MVFPWFSHGFPIIFKTQPRTAAAGRIGRGTMGDMHSSIMPCQRHQGHGVTVGPRQGHTGATNIWLCLTQIMPFTWGTDGKAGKAKKNALNFGAPPLLNKGIILLYGHGSRFQDMLDSWNILELHEPHALDPLEATWPSGGSPCLACSTCIGLACAATSVGDKNTRTRRPEMAPKSIQTLGNQLKSWI